jgi:Family of unknown function (DUF6023)
VIPDRARGVQLYALTALVLLGGGLWFFAAAPETGEDPRVRDWRDTVTRELPDVLAQAGAGTVVLGPGVDTDAGAAVPGGSFRLTMLCAGVGQVRVRLSETGDDTGRPVPCADQPKPVTLGVGLGAQFHLFITAETPGPAVFRWRLTQAAE